jgi:superfamily I DNA and/or RNA helicase
MIEKSLGFLLDERRLNVAITRPKYFLMIVGNSQTLKKSDIWDNLINYCRMQGKYIKVEGRHQYETLADFKKHVLP